MTWQIMIQHRLLLEVKDLIDCFPDEDEHLMKFCTWRPNGMTVKELLNILQCSPPAESQGDDMSSGWKGEGKRHGET